MPRLLKLIVYGSVFIWILWLVERAEPDAGFHLWILDVGQGDAILVQTPGGQQILIDGGPGDRVLPELAKHMPFWDRTIEQVILTHNHADHLSGLIEVGRRYTFKNVWLSGAIHTTPEYLSWLELLRDRQIPTSIVWAGSQTKIDAVDLKVIFPLTDQTGLRPANQHAATVVTRLTYQDLSVLLTGDLEEDHEATLVEALCPDRLNCPNLAAQVLKVPHHGSQTGLLPAFLQAVNPEIAVISCGRNNPYGHPTQTILTRLGQANIDIYRTDQDGTVAITYPNQQIQVHRVN